MRFTKVCTKTKKFLSFGSLILKWFFIITSIPLTFGVYNVPMNRVTQHENKNKSLELFFILNFKIILHSEFENLEFKKYI